jgi:NAD-dependent SIR2 family protein deacetylase
MTKKKYSIKETINYDVCECVYCGHIFNGREAMNGDMDKSSVECPNCEKEMNISISVQYVCTEICD